MQFHKNAFRSVRFVSCLATLAVVLMAVWQISFADEAKKVKVSEGDKGKKIELTKGQKMELRLPVRSGTGFLWIIAKNDRKVLEPTAKPKLERGKGGLLGGKATMVFQFEAKASGKSELVLHYKRPFEKKKAPAKTFQLKVQVK